MKKIFFLGIILFCFFIFATVTTYAAEEPYYDEEFNYKSGAFYANGTDIIIEESNGQTIIKWDDKEQIVPNTVIVFGGGSKGKNFENSNITMNSGDVYAIVGGGLSIDQNLISSVKNANITVNGGNILGHICGGGYVYSEVNNSTITINNGTTTSIIGGGIGTFFLEGRLYYVETSIDAKNSPNRVNNVSITINDITINAQPQTNGIIYAGGQEYTFVGESNLTINGGNMSKAIVMAGGDSYVNKSNVVITGGTINLYQSTNRGSINNLKTKITGGNIQHFFVGANIGTASSGNIEQCDMYLVKGNIENLESGEINSSPLIIDGKNYKVVKTEDMTITNNSISEDQIIQVDYYLSLYPKNTILNKGFSRRIKLIVSTKPEGYEHLFIDNTKWESNNNNVASISDDGVVTAVNSGTAEITASYLEKTDTMQVTVSDEKTIAIQWLIILPIIVLLIMLIV